MKTQSAVVKKVAPWNETAPLWCGLVDCLARLFHETAQKHFHVYGKENMIVFYDNHPWKHRKEFHDRLSEDLRQKGIHIVTEGEYPKKGKGKGYTKVWILRADAGASADVVEDLLWEVFSKVADDNGVGAPPVALLRELWS